MTEEQLIEAVHHLANEEEKVIKLMQLILEALDSGGKRLRASEGVKKSSEELLTNRVEMVGNVSDVLDSLVEVLRANTVMLNENTDRLNQFTTKLDTYLGGGAGLQHVN